LVDAEILRDEHGWQFVTIANKPMAFSPYVEPSPVPLKTPHLKQRMLPPPPRMRLSFTIQDRSHSAPAGGGYLDVPVEDARVMAYGGWLDCGPVGLTENRPVPGNAFEPLRGKTYFDTDLQTLVIYDGVNCRNIMASAVVGRTHPSLMIPLEPSSGGFSVKRGRRIHDFQSCSFSHSDNSPGVANMCT
jgi:hypothetical protein